MERLDVLDQECIKCRLCSGRTEFFVNIKKAKKQIRNAMELYLKEDRWGDPCIPESEQRPIVLMGPPGIGKTAIVSQLAEEVELAFVSYSRRTTQGRVRSDSLRSARRSMREECIR